ncbi:coiled-coil domain-containing protein 9B isoform X2 [Kryptolebias marmoratus]|uniref:Coiled-coil domain containing 9B n=1 Tax=Kryptolebias marmoratus TaxID=37003 RepID=A0A3Q3AUP2_KRYMA|nr:coiled-coil domain-containing protein 9B isoform X2 [Kryptolebias marmoratus]
MERPTTSAVMPKRDHERDLELDKKIEALRRKNEALMKRHKEVEEDRKKAEEEGMALQSRKGKADDLTITISKFTDESRVVVTKPSSGGSPAGKGQQEPGADREGDGLAQSSGRGHRKQLTVTMGGKKGKRVVSERPEKKPGPSDVKSPEDNEEARHEESAGKEKQQSQPAKREAAAAQEQGDKHTEEHPKCQEAEILQASTDLNIPTSREEQEEYLRWKKEREQIDRERVARHKNAKGQWRRAWDVDKTENMFSDKRLPDRDWGPSSRGGRNARRGQQKAGGDSRGHGKRGKDKAAKNVLVMSSKAKGKDRLTGRARRWQADDDEDGENRQASDTTLEEFLEELDALTDANRENLKDQDSKALSAPEEAGDLQEDPVPQKKAQASPPRGPEKKVRFSEELIQAAPAKQTSLDFTSSEPKGSSKAPSPKKNKHEAERPQLPAEKQGDSQDKGGSLCAPPVAQQQVSEAEHPKKERSPPAAPSSPPADKASASLQPVEVSKCSSNSTNSEELIDSSLSVLRLESRETHPAHSTSSDKAREHGKIV